jgi:hypothetical protein
MRHDSGRETANIRQNSQTKTSTLITARLAGFLPETNFGDLKKNNYREKNFPKNIFVFSAKCF